MSNLTQKIENVQKAIQEVSEENEVAGAILGETFNLGLMTLDKISKNDTSAMDISEQIEFLSSILGIDVKELVLYAVNNQDIKEKEVDGKTVSFIMDTLDINKGIDNYEDFLKGNIQDNLDYLKGEL